MTKVFDNITYLTGNTPIVKLEKISKDIPGNIWAKVEYFNPMGSIKDRIGIAMIEAAEKEGKIKEDTTIIEPTSGNTGIALAFICASRGYPLILTMPDTMSIERRKLLKALGTEVILTPGEEGMQGAVKAAEQKASEIQNSYIPQQFKNQANPEAHRKTTAVEIWEDTGGEVDMIVSGVGTGGTITGVTEVLKNKKPGLFAIAVEPEGSPVLSGGKPGTHKIQGIGAGFIPDILNIDIIDEIIKISDNEAMEMTRRLAMEEGVFAGISSGANVAAAVKAGSRPENTDKTIVTFICDLGDRYLSTNIF
ncbi:cysteine synthase A [Elusimicrobiota bacterium]